MVWLMMGEKGLRPTGTGTGLQGQGAQFFTPQNLSALTPRPVPCLITTPPCGIPPP